MIYISLLISQGRISTAFLDPFRIFCGWLEYNRKVVVIFGTLPPKENNPSKIMVGRLNSFWKGHLADMLENSRVYQFCLTCVC